MRACSTIVIASNYIGGGGQYTSTNLDNTDISMLVCSPQHIACKIVIAFLTKYGV